MALTHKGWLDQFKRETLRIVASQTVAEGDLLAISDGEVRRMNDAAGYIPCGMCDGPAEGHEIETGGTDGDMSDPGVRFRNGGVLSQVAVTDVDSEDNIGDWVYATDHETLTLTRPADDACPIGFVWWKKNGTTNTTCDVYVFDLAQQVLLGASGGCYEIIWLLPTFEMSALASSAADILTDFPLYGRGKIVTMLAVVNAPTTDNDADGTLALEIGATAVTGGSITTTDTAGASNKVTPIGLVMSATPTAANEFHDGDTITVKGAYTTNAYSDGTVSIGIVVERLPGA